MDGHFVVHRYFLYAIDQPVLLETSSIEHLIAPGEFCLVNKDQLLRTKRDKNGHVPDQITITLDEPFLLSFKNQQAFSDKPANMPTNVTQSAKSDMVGMFVAGLAPFFTNGNTLDERFADLKRQELLMILLHLNPDFKFFLQQQKTPKRTDLATFMDANFKFNTGIEHFAFLSGRSLSGFKRDFQKVFNSTPSLWLVKRRLEEAYILMAKKGYRPADIYLDLGFEDLSHFSFKFKKLYGKPPSTLVKTPKKLRAKQ